MTGEMMWEAYCRTTNTNCNTRHDIWKFCGGGAAADELANLVLAGIKTATASTKLAYELEGENLPEVGTYSVILFDNEEAACIIRDTKVSVVPFNQVSADHAFKEGEDNRRKNGAKCIGELLLQTIRPLVWISMKREIASWKNLKWYIGKAKFR